MDLTGGIPSRDVNKEQPPYTGRLGECRSLRGSDVTEAGGHVGVAREVGGFDDQGLRITNVVHQIVNTPRIANIYELRTRYRFSQDVVRLNRQSAGQQDRLSLYKALSLRTLRYSQRVRDVCQERASTLLFEYEAVAPRTPVEYGKGCDHRAFIFPYHARGDLHVFEPHRRLIPP